MAGSSLAERYLADSNKIEMYKNVSHEIPNNIFSHEVREIRVFPMQTLRSTQVNRPTQNYMV